MNLWLFLDDWLLDDKTNIARRFPSAEIVSYIEGPSGGGRVNWNAARGVYESIVSKNDSPELWESIDGEKWQKGPRLQLRHEGKVPDGCEFNENTIYAATGGFDVKSSVFADSDDCERPYKLLLFPYTRNVDKCGGIEGGPGIVASSKDGINWVAHSADRWFSNPKGSDTVNSLFFNPRRKLWQVTCRQHNNDRRIFLSESSDLCNWSEPRVIVHPDNFDEPLLQFYAMPVLNYEKEYFFGALQCYHVAGLETPGQHSQGAQNAWSKWAGNTDNQLVYSYDGENWCRSDRSVFVPRTAPGTYGGASIYAVQLAKVDNQIKIYSQGMRQHHGVRQNSMMIVHETRLDGFCYLEPTAGWGSFVTRCFTPISGQITINYQALDGVILVQVTDINRCPLPGFAFEDCIPLTGDKLHGEVRWRSGKSLEEFCGQRIRLEFRLSDARLYAVRLDCGWWYTNTPEPIEHI